MVSGMVRSGRGNRCAAVRTLAGTLLALVFCIGCASRQAQSSDEIVQNRARGAAVAEIDWKCNDAGIYVFRQVAAGERDTASGLPLRDGGSDAVSPVKAAWVSGYNVAIQRYKATEGSPRTVQWTGQFPWNGRYGVRIATATPGEEIVAAKIVEYAPGGLIVSVPQTAIPAKENIGIIFDEYAGDVIGVAMYKISRALIHRNGSVYACISGREVEVR